MRSISTVQGPIPFILVNRSLIYSLLNRSHSSSDGTSPLFVHVSPAMFIDDYPDHFFLPAVAIALSIALAMPDGDTAQLRAAETISAMNVPHMPKGRPYLLRHTNAVTRVAGMAHGNIVYPLKKLLPQLLALLESTAGENHALAGLYSHTLPLAAGDKTQHGAGGVGY